MTLMEIMLKYPIGTKVLIGRHGRIPRTITGYRGTEEEAELYIEVEADWATIDYQMNPDRDKVRIVK